MTQTKRLTPARLMLPTFLLALCPVLTSGEAAFQKERVVRIVNSNADPLEITESKAMGRLARWQRQAKAADAPARPDSGKVPASPRKWTLEPGQVAEMAWSGTSPLYLLEFAVGEQKIFCTIDNYDGNPRLVGEPGLARLTEVDQAYRFAFEAQRRGSAPPVPERLDPQQKKALQAMAAGSAQAPIQPERASRLDPAAVKAAMAEYREAIGGPEAHALHERAARSNPKRRVPVLQAAGRPRLKGASGNSTFKPMATIREGSGKPRPTASPVRPAEAEAPSTESVARNQGMFDFYSGL